VAKRPVERLSPLDGLKVRLGRWAALYVAKPVAQERKRVARAQSHMPAIFCPPRKISAWENQWVNSHRSHTLCGRPPSSLALHSDE
jgi:hypothetical protein